MGKATEIRETGPADFTRLADLYRDAFPAEDLLPLVTALLALGEDVLSLAALEAREVAGHVVLTACAVAGRVEPVALLGPLAVARDRQRQGVGSALIRAGLRRLVTAGVFRVFVLGDPGFYARFGFAADRDVMPPYELPSEWRGAWQYIDLRDARPPIRGMLRVPEPWRRPALWAP